MDRLAVPNAREAEHEPDEIALRVERSDREPTDHRGYAQQRRRHVIERSAPDLQLEPHARGTVFGCLEWPIRDPMRVGTVGSVGGSGGAGTVVEVERHGRGDGWADGRASDNVRPCRAYHYGRPKRSPRTCRLVDRTGR